MRDNLASYSYGGRKTAHKTSDSEIIEVEFEQAIGKKEQPKIKTEKNEKSMTGVTETAKTMEVEKDVDENRKPNNLKGNDKPKDVKGMKTQMMH